MDTQPVSPSFNMKPKKSKKKIILIVILVVLFFCGWAGLTKAGYIPNWTGIELLEQPRDYYMPHQHHGGVDDGCVEKCKANSTSTEGMSGFLNCDAMCMTVGKPVIYLYPETIQDTLVELDFQGTLIAEYPAYDESIGGWSVTAFPDGHVISHNDNKEYSYLFWEGIRNEPLDIDRTKGFVVKGSETRDFLQDILPQIGLEPHEYNEFIVYWYPLMQNNLYNYIHFVGEEYTSSAPLTISPAPDSMLRVFMAYQALDEAIDVQPQSFEIFERTGFSVVEWGGTEIK